VVAAAVVTRAVRPPPENRAPPRGALGPEALRGLAWMALAQVLFSVMTVAARLAARSAAWTTIGAGRALFGALVALAFALPSGRSLRPTRWGLSWARSLLGTCAMIATFVSLGSHAIAVSDAVVLFSTSPLLIALLSPWVLGERPERSLWAILVVAFVGVALVAGPHFASDAKPAIVALLAAVSSALAMMFLRKLRHAQPGVEPESSESIAFHFALVGFVVLATLNLVEYRTPAPADAAWVVVAGVSGGLAQLAMTRAYALAEAARLGAVSYLGTVIAFAGAVVFLGERPAADRLLGATLVVGSGVALALTTARAASRLRGTDAP
jgi:drug/metabolite transporter (DMT)-like permease